MCIAAIYIFYEYSYNNVFMYIVSECVGVFHYNSGMKEYIADCTVRHPGVERPLYSWMRNKNHWKQIYCRYEMQCRSKFKAGFKLKYLWYLMDVCVSTFNGNKTVNHCEISWRKGIMLEKRRKVNCWLNCYI